MSKELFSVCVSLVSHRCMNLPYQTLDAYYTENKDILAAVKYESDEARIRGIVESYVLAQLAPYIDENEKYENVHEFIDAVHDTLANHHDELLSLMRARHAELTVSIVQDGLAARTLN